MVIPALLILGSYLLGAIPFSIIIGYLFAGVDVRKHGSGNAGATNVYRVAGLPAALIAGILDVAKGAAPVLVAKLLFPAVEWLQIVCGVAAVLGHVFPIYVGFRGGKGVNTLLGVFLVLLPVEVGVSLLAFLLVFAVSRIISLSSLTAGVVLSLTVLIQWLFIGKKISTLLLCTCFAVTLMIFFTHRANIRRLVRGEEPRITR